MREAQSRWMSEGVTAIVQVEDDVDGRGGGGKESDFGDILKVEPIGSVNWLSVSVRERHQR